ncbi:MAG: polysaccharide pyruvyl transferase family protein [Blautia sp.]|nr:polysaccharide pyruvyl transferase family protein [Lachnoclostridium sp.]MCM1212201.1 polysaccharide pyruvyl transferase family protein [Blautia sp.]
MKVGTITFHFVNNFGGALQAYALQKTIADECQVSVEIIDYRNWFICFTDTVRLFPVTLNLKELKSGLRTMKQRIGRVRRMSAFIHENCKLTRRYNSVATLRHNVPNFDKFVCGSDQIWNPFLTFGLAEPYFLGFVQDGNKKISYAPSFGSNRLLSRQAKRIKKYLSDFEAISVREHDGTVLVKTLTGRDAVQMIDPVFLLRREEWNEVAIKPEIKGPYILLYIMQHDDGVYAYAKKIKKQLGIQIVEISRYGYQPDFVDVSLVDIGPREFIGLFQNADYICTNSYHGLVFSLIFQKEFCLIPCKKFYLRIHNLLKLLHIETSNVLNGKDSLSAQYDKESVSNTIAVEREKAVQYLTKNILGKDTQRVDD